MNNNQTLNKISTNKITKIAVLSAISIILQYIVPFKVGGFLDVEFSDFPAIIGSFALGPIAGVLVELIKNLVHLLISSTNLVGELANFLVNGVFVLIAGIIYNFMKTKKGALLALLCGTVAMTGLAVLSNRFLLLPIYMKNAPVSVYWNTIFTLITPFNFCRGLVLSLLTFFSYKKLRILLK